jgi:mRNA interferase MazF
MSSIRRGDVLNVVIQRAVGNEIKKDRPWVVLSPDSMNEAEFTLVVAPLSTGRHPYPSRIGCTFNGRECHIILDQMKAITYRRARRRIGAISPNAIKSALAALRQMFEE